jgi:DeoR family glycerol-3-phosphate regulon repressor
MVFHRSPTIPNTMSLTFPGRPARQAAILKAVRGQGSASVTDLARTLAVSDETIRRDLAALVDDGMLVRFHGGVALPTLPQEPSFGQRMATNEEAKRAIARRAAQEVANGDSVMLDTGSTTAYVGRALADHRDLLVVTNCVALARTLATRNGNRVYMAGGELRADDGAALGPSATAFIAQFRVRLAILSVGAINDAFELMDYDLAEAEFSRVVMERAERVIVVADASKFGRQGLVRVAGLDAIDLLITDAPPPPNVAAHLAANEVAVAVA